MAKLGTVIASIGQIFKFSLPQTATHHEVKKPDDCLIKPGDKLDIYHDGNMFHETSADPPTNEEIRLTAVACLGCNLHSKPIKEGGCPIYRRV